MSNEIKVTRNDIDYGVKMPQTTTSTSNETSWWDNIWGNSATEPKNTMSVADSIAKNGTTADQMKGWGTLVGALGGIWNTVETKKYQTKMLNMEEDRIAKETEWTNDQLYTKNEDGTYDKSMTKQDKSRKALESAFA